MVGTPAAASEQVAATTAMFESGAGIDWAYDLLDDVCVRYGLADALLVVRPDAAALQLFRRGRRPVPPHRMAVLATCPSGVVDPRGLPIAVTARALSNGSDSSPTDGRDATVAVLGKLCDAHFRALVATHAATVDQATGLLSRRAIDGALVRAAACGARYGWTTTVVVLATGGDEPADRRWQALAGALRDVRRAGDEAGVLATGIALVLLGNVGADAVRTFVERVRDALRAAGFDGIDLFAATATTPRESVDPAQLRQLAIDRLEEMGAPGLSPSEERATAELEVRSVPGVVWVAWGSGRAPHVTVGAWSPGAELEAHVTRRVHEHFPEASVSVVDAGAAAPDLDGPHAGMGRGEASAPPLRVATAPGTGRGLDDAGNEPAAGDEQDGDEQDGDRQAAQHAARVGFVQSCFDPAAGTTEVTLALGRAHRTGCAPAGPLLGGAQATIDALRALGEDVPFYLISAERVLGVPGEPVVVVLGPRHGMPAGHAGSNERIGVAAGADDADAASRATLGALNRYLSRPGSS